MRHDNGSYDANGLQDGRVAAAAAAGNEQTFDDLQLIGRIIHVLGQYQKIDILPIESAQNIRD